MDRCEWVEGRTDDVAVAAEEGDEAEEGAGDEGEADEGHVEQQRLGGGRG